LDQVIYPHGGGGHFILLTTQQNSQGKEKHPTVDLTTFIRKKHKLSKATGQRSKEVK
jgi:hypothetical protein